MESYIIQSKNNILIKKSSSGGIFAELASYILSQHGIVFGCTMERVDDGFTVKHIYIENENDLYKLQGSKYVQSNVGNSLKQAKEFLEHGRLVLYSGTPCQIAGLKSYLKNNYENLLTIDLSCTGTPSIEIFNDYIKFLEKKYNKKIINFEFRNKEKLGWTCGNALITFEDGKQKILYYNTSSYLNLFINKQIQNQTCQNCTFNGLERLSDITLADAWGIENEYHRLVNIYFNKKNGLSLILVNTPKAKFFLDNIKENIIIKEVDINKLIKYNEPLNKTKKVNQNIYLNEYKTKGYIGLNKLFIKSIGLKYYYDSFKSNIPLFIKHYIKQLNFKQNKTDCLLYTMFFYPNYGSILTAYALQKAIEKLGYSTKLINFADYYGYNKYFIKKHLKLTKKCVFYKDFKNLNNITNTFILGSDNLVNLKAGMKNVSQALLNFTNNDKKRLMISGSIGDWDGTTQNIEEYNYIKFLLERFNYISTREDYGKKILKNIFNVDADWINDPVFYLIKEDYTELIKDIQENYNNKIMQYILYPNANTKNIVDFYKKKFNAEIVRFDGNQKVKFFKNYKKKTVEHWLSAIINSKLVITDSFHCIAFCLIFNKKFICIKNTHATVRFTSLFKRLKIDIPLIESVKDIENIDFSYDKNTLNNSLENLREYALEKIQENLDKTNKEIKPTIEMEKFNKNFLKNKDEWYKKNRLFYFLVIRFIVVPIKRLWIDLNHE